MGGAEYGTGTSVGSYVGGAGAVGGGPYTGGATAVGVGLSTAEGGDGGNTGGGGGGHVGGCSDGVLELSFPGGLLIVLLGWDAPGRARPSR